MIQFRIVAHKTRPGVEIIEVWCDDRFVATIAPGMDNRARCELKVLTKHELSYTALPQVATAAGILNIEWDS